MLRNPKAILALLTALNLLNYVDRFILSAVLVPMRAELHLSGVVSGWLPTFFLLGYFATSPIFGHFGDKGGGATRTALIALGVGVWSLATVGSGLAQNAVQLCAARALVGVGEASYTTLAPTLIDDIAPPAHRGKWMGLFSAATPLGSALGYIIGGQALAISGWRSAFVFVGAPGIVAAFVCLLVAVPRRQTPPAPSGWNHGLRALAAAPLYRSVVLGYAAYSFAIVGFAFWAPSYLHGQYGLSAARASVLFGLVSVAGGAIGTLLGGVLSDRSVKRSTARTADGGAASADARAARANLRVISVACAVGAPLAAAAIAAPTAPLFFGLALPCLASLFVLSGPINIAILKSAPADSRANAMGLAIFVIHAFGDLWSPALIGWLGERMPLQIALGVVPAVFAVGAAIWWAAAFRHERLTFTASVR